MQPIEPRPRHLLFGLLSLLIIAFLILHHAADFLLTAYQVLSYGTLGLLLLCILFPFGSMSLQPRSQPPLGTPSPPKPSRWHKILALQLSLFCLFIGLIQVSVSTSPHPIDPIQITAWAHTALTLSAQSYLWLALYSIHLAYTAFTQEKPAYLGSTLSPIIPHSADPRHQIGIIANFHSRMAAQTGLIIVLSTLMLSLVLLCHRLTSHQAPILTALFFWLISQQPSFKRLITQGLQHSSALRVIGITAGLIAGLSCLLLYLTHSLSLPIHLSALKATLTHPMITTQYSLLSLSWWLLMLPLSACHLAQLAQGHRIRSTLLIQLILPAGLWVLTRYAKDSLILLCQPHPLLMGLSIIGTVYYLRTILQVTHQDMLVQTYLPQKKRYRHAVFLVRKVLITSIIVYGLGLAVGMDKLTLILLSAAIGMSLHLPIVLLSSLQRLYAVGNKGS